MRIRILVLLLIEPEKVKFYMQYCGSGMFIPDPVVSCLWKRPSYLRTYVSDSYGSLSGILCLFDPSQIKDTGVKKAQDTGSGSVTVRNICTTKAFFKGRKDPSFLTQWFVQVKSRTSLCWARCPSSTEGLTTIRGWSLLCTNSTTSQWVRKISNFVGDSYVFFLYPDPLLRRISVGLQQCCWSALPWCGFRWPKLCVSGSGCRSGSTRQVGSEPLTKEVGYESERSKNNRIRNTGTKVER